MQWKLPFSEYFESDKSRLNRISSEFRPDLNKLVTNNANQMKNTLSEEQQIVISRFPLPFDTMDQNWQKMETLVNEWKNKNEIWPMSYNMKIVAAVNGISSLYISHLFRKAFKLAPTNSCMPVVPGKPEPNTPLYQVPLNWLILSIFK